MVNNGEFPVVKGHILNEEDLIIRKHILNLMCRLETSWDAETAFPEFENAMDKLQEMQKMV